MNGVSQGLTDPKATRATWATLVRKVPKVKKASLAVTGPQAKKGP